MEILGHILGVLAVICFFISYQIRGKRPLLLLQTLATALLCVQYLLIGAFSGFALNVVCICRNLCFYHRNKRFFSGLFFPILFAAMMAVVSVFSYEGPHSLLITLALMANTICLGVCEPQPLRVSVICTCSLLVVYNIFAHSPSGLINESISVIAAVIGLIRHHRHPSPPPSQEQ